MENEEKRIIIRGIDIPFMDLVDSNWAAFLGLSHQYQ